MKKKEFNTYNTSLRLTKGGIGEQDAQIIAAELTLLQDYCSSKFIKSSALDEAIRHYTARIEAKITASRFELLKWFVTTTIVQTICSVLVAIATLTLF